MLFLNTNYNAFFFFSISFLSFFSLFLPSFADVDSRNTPPLPSPSPSPSPPSDFQVTTSNFSTPPPAPPLPPYTNPASPFKPSIAVIIGVLTTIFSLTLLLLLYAKHCKRGNGMIYNAFSGNAPARGGMGTSTARKNSGIDRTVIESLPIFRFSSLRGQKDGLECAVCLTRFESPEVLRLLPKCKHAFHVECVDTWLDAHSTCPLCRYRVDPEDILLIDNDSATSNILHGGQLPPAEDPVELNLESGRVENESETEAETTECNGYRRISGRHSSAGERASANLSQIVVQRQTGGSERVPSRFHGHNGPASFARRSLDSFALRKKNNDSVAVGCFDRYPSHQRKDGLLLTNGDGDSDHHHHHNRGSRSGAGADKTRFEHRIIISGSGFHNRWSDVQPSDLLYLQSELILSESRQSVGRRQRMGNGGYGGEGSIDGRSVINVRSVSEITGLNRFSSRESNRINRRDNGERQAGLVSRWLAWISSQSQRDVRLNRTPVGAVP